MATRKANHPNRCKKCGDLLILDNRFKTTRMGVTTGKYSNYSCVNPDCGKEYTEANREKIEKPKRNLFGRKKAEEEEGE